MYEIYNKWPQIAKESSNENFQKIDFKSIDHIVFAGMGGSGSVGDVIGAILSKKDIHVTNVKGYLLPKTVDENTLVIATSVSGNSIEVLEILKNVKKMSTKVVGFSSGGKMENLCLKNNIYYQKIPMIHSPRASFPKFLFSILNILEEVIPINQNEINESILGFEETRKNISTKNLNENNKSLDLAKFVTDLPYIYYPAGLKSAAIRFKNSLQENAKTHALTEDVIESCHNGIVGWSMKSESNPIFIQGYNDHIKTIERWSILKEFFEDKKIQYKIVKSNEGGILSKIVNLIYLLDYTTIYSSVLRNIDPTPVEPIDYIKNKLDKN
jgi:glucose/mannose-6-phosphate isomerase|tara:strand:- start:10129 stop:11106 length:978 start_codon:yes stop_codon:yes gene_type:complete